MTLNSYFTLNSSRCVGERFATWIVSFAYFPVPAVLHK